MSNECSWGLQSRFLGIYSIERSWHLFELSVGWAATQPICTANCSLELRHSLDIDGKKRPYVTVFDYFGCILLYRITSCCLCVTVSCRVDGLTVYPIWFHWPLLYNRFISWTVRSAMNGKWFWHNNEIIGIPRIWMLLLRYLFSGWTTYPWSNYNTVLYNNILFVSIYKCRYEYSTILFLGSRWTRFKP